MDIYQQDYVLHQPEESHGGMYRAEVPALQGCRAWGDTRRKPWKNFGQSPGP